MSSGKRHLIGLVYGLLASPTVFLALSYTMGVLSRDRIGPRPPADQASTLALMVLIAVVLGAGVGSRLSPLASLLPGIALLVPGMLWIVDSRTAFEFGAVGLQGPDALTSPLSLARAGYLTAGITGTFLWLGLLLVVASLPPSRWRPRGTRGSSGSTAPLPLYR